MSVPQRGTALHLALDGLTSYICTYTRHAVTREPGYRVRALPVG
jgi:hypothetical protein